MNRARHLRYRRHFFCTPLACALLLATPALAPAQTGPLAWLFTAGLSVAVNGQRAANGMPINSGDTVSTGPHSSAKLQLAGGGSVQLDADTDPQFLTFLQQGYGCLVRVVFNTGQLYAEGRSACVSFGPSMLLPSSQFNVVGGGGTATLTVVEGKVAASGAQWTNIVAGTQATIAGGRIVAQRPVGIDEMRRITGWRDQYRFTQAAPPPSVPQPFYIPQPAYVPRPYLPPPPLRPGPTITVPLPLPGASGAGRGPWAPGGGRVPGGSPVWGGPATTTRPPPTRDTIEQR